MIRLLFWCLLIYIGYRIVVALIRGRQLPVGTARGRQQAAVTHRDPVCGVYVSEDDAVIGRLGNERHYFCSRACLDKYQEQLDHSSP
jgi:YHS domain-containing protein